MDYRIRVLIGVVLMSFALLQPASARPPAVGLLEVGQSMRDNLRRLSEDGVRVELVLKNGKSYRGKLGAVGEHAVLVAEIEGREFFDALVSIDEIAAIEVRVRDR